ncbi:DMT family transporter [Sneathiella glossodoripedis]|uniref:DMT family transporter n=1 Tax=Sneathiella glossodoripedis TaxID=418853 RepID=UPI0018FF7A3F|nr:DMT family transporter [Sneathiella glossodoripedis]
MQIPISIPGLSPSMHAYVFLTLTTLCWAGNALFSRLAIGEVSPLTLVTFRWLSVILLLIVFARKDLKRDWPMLKPKLGYILAMGAIGFTGFNALFYIGAHYTTAVNIGIIQGTIPMFVFLGTFLLFKTPVSSKQITGVIVTLIGIVVVTSAGSFEQLKSLAVNKGDLLLLIACILYAGYTVALRFKPDVAALSFFSVLAFAALVSCIPLIGYEIITDTVQMPTTKGGSSLLRSQYYLLFWLRYSLSMV